MRWRVGAFIASGKRLESLAKQATSSVSLRLTASPQGEALVPRLSSPLKGKACCFDSRGCACSVLTRWEFELAFRRISPTSWAQSAPAWARSLYFVRNCPQGGRDGHPCGLMFDSASVQPLLPVWQYSYGACTLLGKHMWPRTRFGRLD